MTIRLCLTAVVALVGCGGSPATDRTTSAASTAHVFQLDFGSRRAIDPESRWVLMPHPTAEPALVVHGIRDFLTGLPTTVDVTAAGWASTGGDERNWTAGDLDWLEASAALDAYGGFTQVPGTITFSNLEDPCRVEVVAATGFEFPTLRVLVNGATTTVTARRRAGVDSGAWDARTDGTDAGDWMVWPSVTPRDGTITISVAPGLLNAVRLGPP